MAYRNSLPSSPLAVCGTGSALIEAMAGTGLATAGISTLTCLAAVPFACKQRKTQVLSCHVTRSRQAEQCVRLCQLHLATDRNTLTAGPRSTSTKQQCEASDHLQRLQLLCTTQQLRNGWAMLFMQWHNTVRSNQLNSGSTLLQLTKGQLGKCTASIKPGPQQLLKMGGKCRGCHYQR